MTVSGTKDSAISNADVVITLEGGETFKQEITAGTDVKSWITNLPAGLDAQIKTTVNASETSATIEISGTPTEARQEAIAITVPAAQLTGGSDITVTTNADAKFDIAEEINAVVLTITKPADGGTPAEIGDVNVNGGYFTVESIDWTDSSDSDVSGNFATGETYKAVVVLSANSGYRFVTAAESAVTVDDSQSVTGSLQDSGNKLEVTIQYDTI